MDEPTRLNISTSFLRAELAELKLDLLEQLRHELEKKADQRLVESLDARLATLEHDVVRRDGPIIRKLETYEAEMDQLKKELGDRPELIRRFKLIEEQVREHRAGNIPRPLEARIKELVTERMVYEADAGWTRRERIFASIGVIVLVLSFAFTIYVTASSAAENPPVPPTTTTEGVRP